MKYIVLPLALMAGIADAQGYELICSKYPPAFQYIMTTCAGMTATISPFIYVHPGDGIKSVSFYVDKELKRVDTVAPYELVDGDVFNMLGTHIIDATVLKTDNTTVKLTATFTLNTRVQQMTKIGIEWQPVTDQYLSGYKLYYEPSGMTADLSKYIMISAVPSASVTSHLIDNIWCSLKLSPNFSHTLSFRIKSYSDNWYTTFGYVESDYSESSLLTVDRTYDKTVGESCSPSVLPIIKVR